MVPAAERGVTVLVVDDEPSIRKLTRRALEQAGWVVHEAEHGVDALERLAAIGPVDLLLTDVVMPVMGGPELVRAVRSLWPALPILYMSGRPNPELGRWEMTEAQPDLLHKPFTPDQLVGRVRAVLEQS